MAESVVTDPPGFLGSVLIIALLVVGSFFLTVGTIGLLRLPNVYNRLHATSKATTLGASSFALAAWVYFGPAGPGLKALVTVVFLFVTAPTGGHMISRAAEQLGVEFLPGVTWPDSRDSPAVDESSGDEPSSSDD